MAKKQSMVTRSQYPASKGQSLPAAQKSPQAIEGEPTMKTALQKSGLKGPSKKIETE